MRICFDTNIVIDIFERASLFPESVFAYDIANIRRFDVCMPVSAMTDISYILQQTGSSNEYIKNTLLTASTMFDPYDVNLTDCLNAIKSPMEDFEDAFLIESSKRHMVDLVITRNEKDFVRSDIPAISPADFVKQFCPPDISYSDIDL